MISQIPIPIIYLQVCLERGWKEFVEAGESEVPLLGWNMWWLHNNMSTRGFKALSAWQTTNHSDRSLGFTSKDICTRYLRRLKNTYGDVYDLWFEQIINFQLYWALSMGCGLVDEFCCFLVRSPLTFPPSTRSSVLSTRDGSPESFGIFLIGRIRLGLRSIGGLSLRNSRSGSANLLGRVRDEGLLYLMWVNHESLSLKTNIKIMGQK
jgi:hypothetical protein